MTDYSSSSEDSDTTDEDDDEEVDQEAGEESTSGPEDSKAVYVASRADKVSSLKSTRVFKLPSLPQLFQAEQRRDGVGENHDSPRRGRERSRNDSMQRQHAGCQTGTGRVRREKKRKTFIYCTPSVFTIMLLFFIPIPSVLSFCLYVVDYFLFLHTLQL